MKENLIYGIHAVKSFLSAYPHKVIELFVVQNREDARVNEVLALASAQGLSIQRISAAQLEQWLPHVTHQGLAARCVKSETYTERDLPDVIASLAQPPFFLVLDGVQDPHNLGACLRTADAAGVHGVIIPKDKSVGITPVVRKVASGATESVTVFQVSNLVRSLEQLKKLGVWIMGLSGDATQSLYARDLKGPIALVLGAEGNGLRRLTQECCDFLVKIPMLGVVESLNVSVATAICLYETLRQRQ